jgi:hypothetical protein
MAEEVIRNQKVNQMTVRIERTTNDEEMERFFFATNDETKYYIDLRPANRSSELVAVSLARDAYLHNKNVNIWYETRAGLRWVKALNLWG